MRAYGHWHLEERHAAEAAPAPTRAVRLEAGVWAEAGEHKSLRPLLHALQLLALAAAVTGRVPVVPSVPCSSRWIERHPMTHAGISDDYILQVHRHPPRPGHRRPNPNQEASCPCPSRVSRPSAPCRHPLPVDPPAAVASTRRHRRAPVPPGDGRQAVHTAHRLARLVLHRAYAGLGVRPTGAGGAPLGRPAAGECGGAADECIAPHRGVTARRLTPPSRLCLAQAVSGRRVGSRVARGACRRSDSRVGTRDETATLPGDAQRVDAPLRRATEATGKSPRLRPAALPRRRPIAEIRAAAPSPRYVPIAKTRACTRCCCRRFGLRATATLRRPAALTRSSPDSIGGGSRWRSVGRRSNFLSGSRKPRRRMSRSRRMCDAHVSRAQFEVVFMFFHSVQRSDGARLALY